MKSALLIALLVLSACSPSHGRETLLPLTAEVDEVRVYVEGHCTPQPARSSGLCRTIADPAEIAAIVAFVNARPGDWRTPWYGPPVHPVTIEFFSSGEADRYIGVGRTSLERGHFLSRSATPEEIAEISRLAGLEEAWFDFGRSGQ